MKKLKWLTISVFAIAIILILMSTFRDELYILGQKRVGPIDSCTENTARYFGTYSVTFKRSASFERAEQILKNYPFMQSLPVSNSLFFEVGTNNICLFSKKYFEYADKHNLEDPLKYELGNPPSISSDPPANFYNQESERYQEILCPGAGFDGRDAVYHKNINGYTIQYNFSLKEYSENEQNNLIVFLKNIGATNLVGREIQNESFVIRIPYTRNVQQYHDEFVVLLKVGLAVQHEFYCSMWQGHYFLLVSLISSGLQ